MSPFRTSLALALAMGLFLPVAQAADTSAPLQATAQVARNCSITGTKPLNFGLYDPVTSHATADKFILTPVKMTLRCSRDPASNFVILNIDEGQNKAEGSTCSAPIRQMVSESGKTLRYKIANSVAGSDYRCSGTTKVFLGSQMESSIDVYGQLPAGQNAPGGAYSDNLTVSVVF